MLEQLQGYGTTQHHLGRYRWAAQHARGPILEVACGPGYGGAVLAGAKHHQIVGVDASPVALTQAAGWYAWAYSSLLLGKAEEAPWRPFWKGFETVVSIETIEHLPDDQLVLRLFAEDAPRLVGTVPNADNYPFTPEEHQQDEFPHQRHYTPDSLKELLEASGWALQSLWHQPGVLLYDEAGKRVGKRVSADMQPGAAGLFLGFVAERKA